MIIQNNFTVIDKFNFVESSMKKVKVVLWLIVLIFLGLLVYQNQEYFFSTNALQIDLKISTWQWSLPELQTIAYMGICFAVGFIWAGILGLSSRFRLKKEIKTLNQTVDSHAAQISSLKTELEVYINDPYISRQTKEGKNTLPEPSQEKGGVEPDKAGSQAHSPGTAEQAAGESSDEPDRKDAPQVVE
jgi:uncharacterized integral membrane protein